MPLHRSIPIALCLGTLFLAACGPSEDTDINKVEQEIKKSPPAQTTTTPLPRQTGVLESTGLVAKDERSDIILLLPNAKIAMQEFQRNGLAMLVGRQAGYKLTTQDAAGDAIQQTEQFRQAIATKPAAIFISPIDPPALAALIVEARTAGIAVIGLDKRMLKDGCSSVVFTDQRVVGRMAAQTVLEALKRKAEEEKRPEVSGRIIELRGVEDSYPTNELAEGFSEGLRAQPGVILVHDAAADWSAEKAALRVGEAFSLQKNFDVVYAHSDAIALGAVKAAETAGQRENIFIIGTDGLAGVKRGIELVHKGEIDATIVQPALVDLALFIIVKMHRDKAFKPQPAYEIQPVAIVPKNVEQLLRAGTYKLPTL